MLEGSFLFFWDFWNFLDFLGEWSSFWDRKFLLPFLFPKLVVNAWSSLSLSFSSRASNLASSCAHSSQTLLNFGSFFLGHNPLMKGSHDLGSPFRVVITNFVASTLSPVASIWPLGDPSEVRVNGFRLLDLYILVLSSQGHLPINVFSFT